MPKRKTARSRYPPGNPPAEVSRCKRYCKIPVAVIPATQRDAGPMRTNAHLDKRDSIGRSGTTGSESSMEVEYQNLEEMIRKYQRRMFRDSSRERRLQEEQNEEDLMEDDDDIQLLEDTPEQLAAKEQKRRELEDYKDDEDLLTGKFSPRKVIPREVFPQHHPRRKLPPKNNLEFTRYRLRMKRFIEEVYGLPRPVSL